MSSTACKLCKTVYPKEEIRYETCHPCFQLKTRKEGKRLCERCSWKVCESNTQPTCNKCYKFTKLETEQKISEMKVAKKKRIFKPKVVTM